MKAIDFHLFNALMRKINLQNINSEFCGCDICKPQCQKYTVKLFSKTFYLEYVFTNDYITIESMSIKCTDIVFRISELSFYNEHQYLLK